MEDTPKRQQFADGTSVRGWGNWARISLVVYVIALASFAGWSRLHPENPNLLTSPGEDSIWIAEAASRIGATAIRDLVLFLVLGFLGGAACASPTRGVSIFRVIASAVAGFALSLVIALGFSGLMRGSPIGLPNVLQLTLLLGSTLCGSWLGATWMNRYSFLRWALSQVVLTTVFVIGGLAVLIQLAIATEPLDIASESVSSEDRRRLVRMFRTHDPRKLASDETAELTITERDLNQLASWGLSLLPGDHQARVQLADQQISLQVMLNAPSIPLVSGYANLQSAGDIQVRAGEFAFSPHRFEVGRLKVPQWLLQVSGPIVLDEQWQHGPAEPFLRSLESIDIGDRFATIAYGRLELDKASVRNALVDMGVLEDLEESCNAHVRQLIVLAEHSPRLDFSECMQTAFATAQRRSKNGNAVRENRAAILALAYLLGHSRIRSLVGELDQPSPLARERFGRVTLRGRRDWTRHYIISASLHVLGNKSASLDMGILKEELDADGGSGFSFGDLLADRAGTQFGFQVTESDARARTMQARIASSFPEEDFMPAGSDLPEGISAREFEDKFGGVGGPKYTELVNEIDRRIASLRGFAD
jgi:hypothetical protein